MPAPVQPTGQFQRNILRIASGAVGSQVIVIGSIPLLTRLYDPEQFGALAAFTAVSAITTVIFSLKYDLAILLPADHAKAVRLTSLTVAVAVSLSLFLATILAIFRWGLGAEVPAYYFLLPLSVSLAVIYTCQQQWAGRSNDYRRFAQSQVVNATSNVGISVAMGLAGAYFLGNLVVGYCVGLLAAIALMARRRHMRSGCTGLGPAVRRLKAVASEYRQFPLYVLPSSLIQTAGGLHGLPIVLQAFFALSDIGLVAIGARFLFVPSTLIGAAIGEAFRAEFVRRQNTQPDSLTAFYKATLLRCFLIALPLFLMFYIAAPRLFSFVFGSSYVVAGDFARYLCLGVLAQFIAQPFQYVFIATGRMRQGLMLQTACTCVPIAATLVGSIQRDLPLALSLWSAAVFCLSVALIWLAYKCSQDWSRQALPAAGGGNG